MGSDLSTADEWVEITAIPALTGAVVTESVNLAGWQLIIQKDAGESVIATFPASISIGSGQYLVIANTSAGSSRLLNEPAFTSTAISLPNTKLLLRLRDAQGRLLDEADDFVGAPFAGANPSASSGLPKATMERISLSASGTDKTNWKSATTGRGFDPNAPMLGTPGYVNGSIDGGETSSSSLSYATSSFDSSTSTSMPLFGRPVLMELLPDPPGSQEEWIELANTGSVALDIGGIQLRSGSRTFTIPAGATMQPGEYRLFLASQTSLQLPNSGGEVQLWAGGVMIDHILYTTTPDGVSAGKYSDGSVRSFCVPTPGRSNTSLSPTVTVTGFLRDLPNPATLNLNIQALSGSIAGAVCFVDFGDGYVSPSCNPPSHSMKRIGRITIKTEVRDFCGNTVTQQDEVLIVGGSKAKTPLSSAGSRCIPTATGGLMISEFLPAPHTGNDEWIELQNVSPEPINLCGWSVDDALGGSRAYKLDGQSIEPGQYLVIGSTVSGIALNNDADTVRLIAPDLHGGTGVLLSIPYQDAETDVSFARRDDGVFLPTPFLTPASASRFTSIDTRPGSSPVILSAALPNPTGVDTWDEWIELQNVTGRPQWLNGWHIEDTAGHHLSLDGHVLRKVERQRIALYDRSFTLVNTEDSLRLIDDQGALRSVLAWHQVPEGHIIRLSDDCSEQPVQVIGITDDVRIHAKTGSGDIVTLPMAGVLFTPLSEELKSESKNYLSALLKNKKIVSKNCSDGSYSFTVDGSNVALLLLQQGFAITDPLLASPQQDVFVVYEEQAREQRRGIWRSLEQGAMMDVWRHDRILDHTVATDDIQWTIAPLSSLLLTGSLISVTTNVPTDLWVKEGTGAYRRFDGGVVADRDTTFTFLASYQYKTLSGGTIRTSVISQSYALRRSSYPSCLRISEVYPSPKKGEREWIELENICDEDVSLLGWTIDDVLEAGSKPFIYQQHQSVFAGSRLILSGSLLPIALNNGGDSVVLLSPDGRVQSAMSYTGVSTGRSVALMEDDYCQTVEPTFNMNNKCVQTVAKGKRTSPKSTRMTIITGLGTKYLSSILSSEVMNTENDQSYSFIEGLNRNMMYNKESTEFSTYLAIFLFIIGGSCLVIGIVLYRKKYRLIQ